MKQLLIVALLAITSLGAAAQKPNHQPLPNQFRDYVNFRMAQEGIRHIPQTGHFMPKPKKVIEKKNTIVLVFDKKEFERFQAQSKIVSHRPMMRRPLMWK